MDIINLSLGYKHYDEQQLREIHDAIEDAYQKGVIIVAAPGNHGYSAKAAWPAIDTKRVICANSLDGSSKPSTSNPPTTGLDSFYMIGEGHTSSALNGREEHRSGSSFSTAAVSAMCATILELMSTGTPANGQDPGAKLWSRDGMAYILRRN